MSNHFTITGNLGGDPELRFTASGKAVATVSVGDTPRKYNRDTQQWEDAGDTLWMRCTVWGDKAEALAEQAQRGDRVMVVGRLKSRSFETKEGEKRTVIECDADDIARIGGRKAERSSAPAQGDPWATQQPQQSGWGTAPLGEEPPF